MAWMIAMGAGAALGALGGVAGNDSEQTVSQDQQTATSGQSNFTPTDALMPAYGSVMGSLNSLAQTPQPFFPGQTYVDPSAYTQQGVAQIADAGNKYQQSSPYYQQAADKTTHAAGYYDAGTNYLNLGANTLANSADEMQGVANQAGTNYGFLSGAADVANNPYVQDMMRANERSVMDTLTNQALPGLQAGAVGVNALGSSRLGLAQGQAIGDSMAALANQNAATQMQAYSEGLGAQQNALGQTGALQTAYGAPGTAVGAAGSMLGDAAAMKESAAQTYANAGDYMGQSANALNNAGVAWGNAGQGVESYQQAALDDAMARFDWQYSEPWNRQENTISALNGLANTGTTNTSTGSSTTGTADNPNYQSDWQAALGGAATGAGLGYSLWKK